jgi:Pyruvate/2-oxoacid:ferredoxin oxidoreductase delta subunit
MKPATSQRNAIIASLGVAAFSLYLFHRPFVFLGIFAGIFMGAATYWVLRAKEVQHVRRTILIFISTVVWAGFFAIILWIGPLDLMRWINAHLRVYYTMGVPTYGTTIIPCTRTLPEITLGLAIYGQEAQPGAMMHWPSSLIMLIMVMIPFAMTAVIFGRGWCGWMCFFGGTVETFMGGTKERWTTEKFRIKCRPPRGEPFLGGLREEIKDIKYGVALALLIVAFGATVPIICMICWTFLIQYLWLGLAFIVVVVLFVIIFPFMTKKRWFCILCPAGAMINLVESLSPFEVRIDMKKCDKCFDCMHFCHTYAMTPKAIEEKGEPNLDCTKCGKCMEVCPRECIDLYLRGTEIKTRSWFFPLVLAGTAAWYVWFVFALIQIIPVLMPT